MRFRFSPHFLLAGLLCFAGAAGARGDAAMEAEIRPLEAFNAPDQTSSGEVRHNGGRRPEVGMSLQEALELVGKKADSQEEIGAACGMLDVHTWDEDGTRIISVDGTVTSIVDGSKKKKQP
jgi:hypothetical protein